MPFGNEVYVIMNYRTASCILAAAVALSLPFSCKGPKGSKAKEVKEDAVAKTSPTGIPFLPFEGCKGRVASIEEHLFEKASEEGDLQEWKVIVTSFDSTGHVVKMVEKSPSDSSAVTTTLSYVDGRLQSRRVNYGNGREMLSMLASVDGSKERWQGTAYWGESTTTVTYSPLSKRETVSTDMGVISDEETFYREDGTIDKILLYEEDNVVGSTMYSYDDKGRRISIKVVYGDGEPILRQYEYLGEDEKGNWTEMTTIEDDKVVGSSKRTITYY